MTSHSEMAEKLNILKMRGWGSYQLQRELRVSHVTFHRWRRGETGKKTAKFRQAIAIVDCLMETMPPQDGSEGVLMAMQMLANEDGVCEASQKTIARATGFHKSRVIRKLLKLVEQGRIQQLDSDNGRPRRYYVGKV